MKIDLNKKRGIMRTKEPLQKPSLFILSTLVSSPIYWNQKSNIVIQFLSVIKLI